MTYAEGDLVEIQDPYDVWVLHRVVHVDKVLHTSYGGAVFLAPVEGEADRTWFPPHLSKGVHYTRCMYIEHVGSQEWFYPPVRTHLSSTPTFQFGDDT